MVNYLNLLKEYNVNNFFKHWGWFLTAFFLMDLWWLPDSMFVYLWSRPVPLLLHIIFIALFSALGVLAAAHYFKKAAPVTGLSRPSVAALLCGALTVFLVASAAPIVLRIWTNYLFAMISSGSVNDYAAVLTLLGLMFLLSIIAVFGCFAALTFMIYGVPLNKTGRATLLLLGVCRRRVPAFLLMTLAIVLFSVILLNIMKTGEFFAAGFLPYGFFSRYILGLILAGGKTLFALFLICCLHILLAQNKDKIQAAMEETTAGSLIFPAIVAILTAALVSCSIIPYLNAPRQFTDNIHSRIAWADNLLNTGQSAKASTEYCKAKADTLALQAYLKGIEEISATGELKRAAELFDAAENVYLNSPYIAYFRVLLNNFLARHQKNSPGGNQLFTTAARHSDLIPEAMIWAYSGLQAAGEGEKARQALSLVIAGGVFSDRFAGLGSANKKKTAALLQETEKLLALLAEREIYVILSRAEYKKDSDILGELLAYAGPNPSPEACYQAALLAERIPYPYYMYEYAKKYFASIPNGENMEKEIEAALFTSYMFVKSGHANEAEKLNEAIYEKYPGNKDIVVDYAYTLLENKKPARAAALIDGFPGGKDPALLYIKAMACLEDHNLHEALEAAESLCRMIEKSPSDPLAIREWDEYIYRILLEYRHLNECYYKEGEKFLAELKSRRAPAILYHYIMGLEARQAEDYETSNRCFENLLEINPALAYPYYLLGVNYNEMAGYQGKDCYPQAEKCFLNFIERRPDVVEGYFCLGFVYKHAGDLPRATRAFLKVANLNPARDNPLYEPFSMYNHALNEITINKGAAR